MIKKIWEIIKKIFNWIWILTLLVIAVLLLTELKLDDYFTKYIGSGIIFLLAIRGILTFFNKINSGNPYFYFVVFIIASTFPVLFQEYSKEGVDSEQFTQFIIYYPLAIAAFIYFLGKRGKFGKKMKSNIKKSETKSKKQNTKREKERKETVQKNKTKEKLPLQKTKEIPKKETPVVFCKNCGDSSSSVRTLVINTCKIGKRKGDKHVPFDGPPKKEFTCKHCGRSFPRIRAMIITNSCTSPDKHHEPNEYI